MRLEVTGNFLRNVQRYWGPMNTDIRPWRVLLLSAGYGNEALRDEAHKIVSELGFEVSVYDRPGYPVDSRSHSHAACIKAIDQHDIVVALIDEKEGGTFQVDEIPPGLKSRLSALGVIAEQYDHRPMPTILQVEILAARAMQKPVICLVPDAVRAHCSAVLTEVPSLVDRMSARRANVPDAGTLVASRSWTDLHNSYEVPTTGIAFGQLAFLERICHETPNYISYFNLGRHQDLADHLVARLAALVLEIAQLNLARVESMFRRKRTPVAASESLAWLQENYLIISGPYKPDTVADLNDAPLIRDGHSVALSDYLRGGTSVALVGDPGMGKSTYLLLAAIDLLQDTQGVPPNLLFATWRELPLKAQKGSAEQLIRTLIGLSAGRSAWPDQLPLPTEHWHIVLDGIDEADIDLASLRPLLSDLRGFGTLLVSCREHDFDSEFPIHESFEIILRLRPWGDREIDQYRHALAAQGNNYAVEYIEAHKDDNHGVLNIPLWLAMITFLSGRAGARMADEVSNYALLSQCGSALAVDELQRNGRDGKTDEPLLLWAWQEVAWEIHAARRRDVKLGEQLLRDRLGVTGDQMWNACRSLLSERNGMFLGFVHEALFEYWLAEYIVSAMIGQGQITVRLTQDRASIRLVEALSLQRPVATNRLIRQGIVLSGRVPEAAAALREAFWQADERHEFARNQIPYLLGRIDNSPATLKFLLTIWSNKTETAFVRYSAAHAAVSLGVHSVEKEFYDELSTNPSFDRMNRWYHRFYYGDLQCDERNGLDFDDDAGPAVKAVQRLTDRLRRKQPRHLNLRRIELFTLRRFLETRDSSLCSPELLPVLDEIEREFALPEARGGYADGVSEELTRIRAVWPRG